MKLQQLEYFVAVCKHGFNISEAALHLYTSQPGVSKKIISLEEQLNVQLFTRKGKRITGLTPQGQQIYDYALRIQREMKNINTLSEAFTSPDQGSLNIATTHTQARYFLPHIIKAFTKKYPEVELHVHQSTPKNIAKMASEGEADFAICTEALSDTEDLMLIPCYRWNRFLIVPKDHPLADVEQVSLEELGKYPIVTYTRGFTGRTRLDQTFSHHGLVPNIAISASDADVVKTYVRLGLGVGIIAQMAYDKDYDSELVAKDIGHLFPTAITKVAYVQDKVIKPYMFDFVKLLTPTTDLSYKNNIIIYRHSPGQVPPYKAMKIF